MTTEVVRPVPLAQAYGLPRSYLIYYGLPWRHFQLQRLYAQFVRPGDLCLDVGASAGTAELRASPRNPTVATTSPEWATRGLAIGCVTRLLELGQYEFNWTVGESARLRSDTWISGRELVGWLEGLSAGRGFAEIYARAR